MTDSIGMAIHLAVPYAEAVQRTRDALKSEGFGVLTEVDIQAAFKEKLGREFRPYVILGACNPPLAFTALSADSQVGLLLPCNVTVEAADDGGSMVRLVDPLSLLAASAFGASTAISDVAADAHARLTRVAKALGG
ncbi:MAG: DUF302 domain-containing protein [Gemmatimonadaceae bacterium]|nr:DUF302 domain-containing protein [Gemmatimonadaceae bacterium]